MVAYQSFHISSYPPWAHGVGYILTYDIAVEIATGSPYALGKTLFRLEDVATGIWMQEVVQKKNWTVGFHSSKRYNSQGCRDTDIISHYIKPDHQYHLWKTGKCLLLHKSN